MSINVVDVWMTDPGEISDELLQSYTGLLDEGELERWRRFNAPSAAFQHLVARALVRTTLSRYAEIEPRSWRFGSSSYGRPFIKYPPGSDLNFNVSHTDGLVVCAVTRGHPVGIDVENTSRRLDVQELSACGLSVAEIRSISSAAPDARHDLFLTYWTLKEAYSKALGVGLSLDFESFYFDFSHEFPVIVFSDPCHEKPDQWTFYRLRPTGRHQLGLAISCRQPLRLRQHWVVPPGFEVNGE